MSSADHKSKVIDRKLRAKNKQLKQEMQDFLSSIESSFSLSSIDENKVNENEAIPPSKINSIGEEASALESAGGSDAAGDSASDGQGTSQVNEKGSGEKSTMMSSYLSILQEEESEVNSETSENDSDNDVGVETEEDDDDTDEDDDDENGSNVNSPVSEQLESPGAEPNNLNLPPIKPNSKKQPYSPLTPTSPLQSYLHHDKQYEYYNDKVYNNKRNSSFFHDDDSLVAMAKRLDDASVISDPTVICGADDEDYSLGRDDSFWSAGSGPMHKGPVGEFLSLTNGEPGVSSDNITNEENACPLKNRKVASNHNSRETQEQHNARTSFYKNIDDSGVDPSRQPKHLEILRKAQEMNMKAKMRQQKYQQEQPQRANGQNNDVTFQSNVWQQQQQEQAPPPQKYHPAPPQRQKQNITPQCPQRPHLMRFQIRNDETNQINEKSTLSTPTPNSQRYSRSSCDDSSKHEQPPQMQGTPQCQPQKRHNQQHDRTTARQIASDGSNDFSRQFGNNNISAPQQPKQQSQVEKSKQRMMRSQTRNDRVNPNIDSYGSQFSKRNSCSPQRNNYNNDDAKCQSPLSLDASYESSSDDNNVSDRARMNSSDQAIRTEHRKTSQATFQSSRKNVSCVPPPPPTNNNVGAGAHIRKTSKPNSRRKKMTKNPTKKQQNGHFDDIHPDGVTMPHLDDEIDGVGVSVPVFASNAMPSESNGARTYQYENVGTNAAVPPFSPTNVMMNGVQPPEQSGQPSNTDTLGNKPIHRGVRISQWKDRPDEDTPPRVKHRLWGKVPKAKVTQYKEPRKVSLDDSMRGLGCNTRIHDKQQQANIHSQQQTQPGPMPHNANGSHPPQRQTSSANHSQQQPDDDVGSDYNSDCQTEFFYESGSDDSDDYYESDGDGYDFDDEDLPAVGTSVAQAVADLNNQRPLTKVKNLLRMK